MMGGVAGDVVGQCDKSGSEHIVFSPHFDDAALSCGGLISKLTAEGNRVRVVTVFAGETDPGAWSAFAQHLAQKWSIETTRDRRQEDLNALEILGVAEVAHWDVPDAPYRTDAQGQHLYQSYAAIQGEVAAADEDTVRVLDRLTDQYLTCLAGPLCLYFPLGLGRHVDHQLLYAEGLRVLAAGRSVSFYEEWPYVEAYVPTGVPDWDERLCEIQLDRKIRAVQAYGSQLKGLGGSPEVAASRLAAYAGRVGRDRHAERYWTLSRTAIQRLGEGIRPERPFRQRPDLSRFQLALLAIMRASRALSTRASHRRTRPGRSLPSDPR